MTKAPAAQKARTMASPIPFAPPVIMIDLSLIFESSGTTVWSIGPVYVYLGSGILGYKLDIDGRYSSVKL